jgi:hypothetical protein
MQKPYAMALAATVTFGGFVATATAESHVGMKLYAFSSGALTIGKGVLQNF